jgi:predicted RNA-binding protein YlxR (DUF448 family)
MARKVPRMASKLEKAGGNLIFKRRRRSIINNRSLAAKAVPKRTCVACRQIKAKRELVRLVHTPEDNIEIDVNGKKKGRGAYLCPTRECWEKALKGNQLERALRGGLTQDNRAQLFKDSQDLLKGVN